MTILYDYENEQWVDTKNKEFKIEMTPDGDTEELERQFDDFEDWYCWYRGKDYRR